MLKLTKKRGSVFTLLLRNYIIFTIAMVIVLCSVFAIFVYRNYQKFVETDLQRIKENSYLLEEGTYDQFPATRILGETGFIAVIDDKGNTIYNGGNIKVELSMPEISYISNYSFIGTVSITALTTADKKTNYQISYRVEGSGDGDEKETYIIDQDYKLVYGSGNFITSDLSEKEFKLLSQNYFKGHYVSKYTFKTGEGKAYTALLFQMKEGGDIFIARGKKTFYDSVIIFLVAYCVMIMCFILWLKRQITTPLELLCSQLNDFELGNKILPSYKGPKEFQAIFDSFSAMTAGLERSESERINLESDKRTMLADITHDLKTPITVVQGYAKALSDGVIPIKEQQKYINTIALKADELNQLINTFYEYNKLEHPSYQLNLERTDICNFLRDYVAEKYNEIEAVGFLTSVQIPEKHIYCQVDQILLKRAFENIVGNSIKHNSKDTILYFKLMFSHNQVKIILGDNGVGISGNLNTEVFLPFVMGDDSRNGTGSGLGLSVAKRIVTAHGGEIKLLQDTPPYKVAFEIILSIN